MALEVLSPSEPGSLSIKAFIKDVEGDLSRREDYAAELSRYRGYFEALGGTVVNAMPLPDGKTAIAKSYSPLNKMAYVQPVDPKRPLKRTVIRQYPLSDVLAQSPAFPDFWESVAESDVVSEIVYSQSPFDRPEEKRVINIGEDGDIAFPDCLVEVRDDTTVRVYFIDPKGMLLKYPHCIAEDTFSFAQVPKEIDRAFRIYNNACKTRRKPLFWDVDPSHANYRHRLHRQRIAIEYKAAQPNRMRPVIVKV